MAIIKKIKLPNEANARDIGALSSNVIYDGDAGTTTTLNEKIQSIFTAIGDINSFEIALVNALPTENIDDHTIYFVPNAQDANVRDEYMYVGNQWEMIGSTTIDLSDYPTYSDISIAQGLTTGIPAATITVGTTETTIYNNYNAASYWGNSSTSADTAIKVVSCTAWKECRNGAIIGVKFVNAHTASSLQLNVNSTGAKYVSYSNTISTTSSYIKWDANTIVYFMYANNCYNYITSIPITSNDPGPEGVKVWYGTYNVSSAFSIPSTLSITTVPHFILTKGSILYITFTYSGTDNQFYHFTSSQQINVNGTGAKKIIYKGQYTRTVDIQFRGNDTLQLIYNGTDWVYVGQSLYDDRYALISNIPQISVTLPSPTLTGPTIASISVNGTTTTLNAPEVTVTQGLTTGITVGSIDVNGNTTTLYAPEASDTKVTQTDVSGVTENIRYPVLISAQTSTLGTTTTESIKSSYFEFNPGKNYLTISNSGSDNNGGLLINDYTSRHNLVSAQVKKAGTSSTFGIAVVNIGNRYTTNDGSGNSMGSLAIFGKQNIANVIQPLDETLHEEFTKYANYLPAAEGVLPVGATTGVGSSTVPVYMNSNGELLACTLPAQVTYSLSMTGATITLQPSSGTASTITLPIYDGTIV